MNEIRAQRGWVWALIVAAIAGGGGALAYAKVVRPNIVPKNFGVVEEGKLYRSGWLTPAATERLVAEHHVRTIVDLGGYDKDESGERVAQRTAEALGVERRVFRLEGDGTGNPNAYVEALRVMADASKQPVLVHCSAGSERTGMCVLMYRRLVQGRSNSRSTDLYAEAEQFHHDDARNPQFRKYLEEWGERIGDAFKAGTSIEGQPKAEIVSPAKGR